MLFVLWETYSWFWLFRMEPKQDILWLKGCFFICFPPNKTSHPFYRLPFSNSSSSFLKKRQRKSEDLNSIQTALQIWDFQATPVFATQMMNVLKILKIWFILLRLWPTLWTCCLRPVFVTSGSSLSTTLTSVSNAFTDFWGLTYFLSKFYQTNQQVSISLLSKIMDFLKVLIESIYCCEEWTMIKNLWIECLCLSIPCNDFRNKPDVGEEESLGLRCCNRSFVSVDRD